MISLQDILKEDEKQSTLPESVKEKIWEVVLTELNFIINNEKPPDS